MIMVGMSGNEARRIWMFEVFDGIVLYCKSVTWVKA
jgi:hypothetical protein